MGEFVRAALAYIRNKHPHCSCLISHCPISRSVLHAGKMLSHSRIISPGDSHRHQLFTRANNGCYNGGCRRWIWEGCRFLDGQGRFSPHAYGDVDNGLVCCVSRPAFENPDR